MRPDHVRYRRQLLASMLAYVVVLWLAVYAQRLIEPVALRALVALLPLLPLGFAARAMLRHVRACDELEQRIELESLAVAALLLTFGTFALGLLSKARVVSVDGTVALVWILPLFILLHGLCRHIALRRYR